LVGSIWSGHRALANGQRGSWQERQIYDRDPFSLPQDDRRGKTEFWLPLIFYLFAWLVSGQMTGLPPKINEIRTSS
jgi:hypothetical protein